MSLDMFNLTNKNAVIVGGAGDLGFSIIEGFLNAGASIVCIDKDPNGQNKIDSLNNKSAHFLEVDITNREEITSSIIESKRLLSGNIHIY